MSIDEELRHVLRRQQAPHDLAERVLSRVGANHSQPAAPLFGHSARRWLAAAALLVVSAGAAERYYVQQQQAAEVARMQQEMRIALQITNDALAHVQSKLSTPAEKGRR
jgi:hypothetical protein